MHWCNASQYYAPLCKVLHCVSVLCRSIKHWCNIMHHSVKHCAAFQCTVSLSTLLRCCLTVEPKMWSETIL